MGRHSETLQVPRKRRRSTDLFAVVMGSISGFALLLSAPPGGTVERAARSPQAMVTLTLNAPQKTVAPKTSLKMSASSSPRKIVTLEAPPKIARAPRLLSVADRPVMVRKVSVSVASVPEFTPTPAPELVLPESIAALPPTRSTPELKAQPGKGPKIALIIDDMGLDRRRSAQIAALKGKLTLAYLPYARDLPAQTAAARAAGHELLVHIPMESRIATANAGPNVLRASLSAEELTRRLTWALGRFEGFVGVNNHMGSRFTSSPSAMRMMLAALAKRNLLFVDSRTSSATVARRIAGSVGIRFAERDVFLDHDDDHQSIASRLKELERIARRDRVAIGIGHPRDATIAALRQWIPDARKRGFVLVPISAATPPRITPVVDRVTALRAGPG